MKPQLVVPRARGCASQRRASRSGRARGPPRAWMRPKHGALLGSARLFPPLARGCTQDHRAIPRLARVSSSRAWMHPDSTGRLRTAGGLLRARVDAPTEVTFKDIEDESPPRARGCTPRSSASLCRRSVSSARAWMHPTLPLARGCTLVPGAASAPTSLLRARGCTGLKRHLCATRSSIRARMLLSGQYRRREEARLHHGRGCTAMSAPLRTIAFVSRARMHRCGSSNAIRDRASPPRAWMLRASARCVGSTGAPPSARGCTTWCAVRTFDVSSLRADALSGSN